MHCSLILTLICSYMWDLTSKIHIWCISGFVLKIGYYTGWRLEGEIKGCGGRRLGLIGAKDLSHGKSRRNREGNHGLSSSPARPREEERGKGEGVADVRARRVSDREKRDPAASEKREREGKARRCGAAWAVELGRDWDEEEVSFFYLIQNLFQIHL